MTPEQAAFLLQLALPPIKREHATTRAVIAAIPLNNGNYKSDPNAKTALELAWHIVTAEHRFFGGAASGVFNLAPIDKPESAKDSAGITKWYEESFAKDIELLASVSGEQLAKMMDFRGMFQMPR